MSNPCSRLEQGKATEVPEQFSMRCTHSNATVANSNPFVLGRLRKDEQALQL